MSKKFFVLLIIWVIISGFFIFNFRKTEKVEAAAPIAAMKTLVDGKFYVPDLNPDPAIFEPPQSLKVDRLFDNPDLEGDQTGVSGEPDGTVDMIYDARLVNKVPFGTPEGGPDWEYMADIVADRKVDIFDIRIPTKNFGKSGTYIDDPAEIIKATITFQPSGVTVPLDATGACNVPAGDTSFVVKDKNGNPIGAYILFYAGPPPDCCPQITYSCSATVEVGENFQCTQNYTHTMGSWGGINFNWLSEMADISGPITGCIPGTESPPNTCLNINGIACTCGDPGCYEVFECSVNHGDTVTLTLNAKKIGDLDVHHRAWDWSYDAVCPYPEVDRDPVSGTCSTNCDQFPDTDVIVCDKHTTTVKVKPLANDCDLLGGFCFLGHAPQCNLLCSPLSGDCYFTPEQCGTDCCCVCFLVAPVCGDGAKEAGEACDDGNTNNCDGCKGDCLRLDNVCGDGIAECGEECDKTDDAACPGKCQADCKCPVVPPPKCTPDSCNGNCPAGCGGAADPDCPGQCLHCTCTTDIECTNKCTAGNGCCSGCTPIDPDCRLINPLTCATFPECIEKIISFIFWVAMAIAPIMIIIAGFLFLTSGGDPEKVRSAKRIILYAVIGLTIILLAKGIISLIKTVIGS